MEVFFELKRIKVCSRTLEELIQHQGSFEVGGYSEVKGRKHGGGKGKNQSGIW
jgi:hypothetical protein